MYDNRAFVWLLRFSVFVGLLSAVVTVIYLTPVPELQHASCLRPCHELDWPMICRVKIVLESSNMIARSPGVCATNKTDCTTGECILGTKVRHKIITANGQLPGPTIEVCEKDILVVDVVNRVIGSAVTVHWRGQSQRETPYMDGVSMVTQCPINGFTTFQYKFRATEPGTHLWQVQAGNAAMETVFGALVVRQSPKKEPHHDLYDEDDYFVLISELPSANGNLASASLLINGQPFGQNSQELSQFNITAQRRHRLRIAYAVASVGCPVSINVDQHSLLIIAIDGHSIRPVEVQSLRIAPGERVDAVLTADQEMGDYMLRARTSGKCSVFASSSAVLSYQLDHTAQSTLIRPSYHHSTQLKRLSTVGSLDCSQVEESDLICLPNIESLTKMPSDLAADRLDFTLYLSLDSIRLPPRSVFEDVLTIPRLNNLTLTFPSSPLLSQINAVESETICSESSQPAHCDSAPICECVHIIDIPLHTPVEIVLTDQGGDGDHIFHLHGHSFYVVGTAMLSRENLPAVKGLDSKHQLITRNLKNPVLKDTVSVPSGGVVGIRFKADNPGYWLLHDELSSRLGVILHVGDSDDVPRVPEDFPTCGSWVGPEFFLI